MDKLPIEGCRACHNTAGYSKNPIVRKVHGVHMGKLLQNPANTDPATGAFKLYSHVVFPAGVRNCTTCHTDDAWKERVSRLACGACHDTLDFGTGKHSPALVKGKPAGKACKVDADCTAVWGTTTCNVTTGSCERSSHTGGKASTDDGCQTCHTSDGSGLADVGLVHAVTPPVEAYAIEASLTAPQNGTHYLAGEAPVLTIVIKDSATGAAIEASKIDAATFSRANLFVHGPSSLGKPALTSAASGIAAIRATVTSTANGPFNLAGVGDLKLVVDGTAITIPVVAAKFADPAKATTAEVAAWLTADAGFAALATASVNKSSTTDKVVIKSNKKGAASTVEVVAGDGATALLLPVGVAVPVESTYAGNELRVPADPIDADPKLTRSGTQILYALDDVGTLAVGTYTVFIQARPVTGTGAVKYFSFQVGNAKEDVRIAGGCTDCHKDNLMHGSYPFQPDVCRSCHDYKDQIPGKIGWNSSNNGFGAGPISRRVHGVHFGKYVNKPKEIHAKYDYSEVIFPQDVRNCTKCHTESTSWTEKPVRLACLACHDGDAVIGHAALNTLDPTPDDPWSGDEVETCAVCHDASSALAPDVVHDVWTTYKPPYKRE